jgi:NADH-quinone oxidoreductase subunit C
MRPLVSVGSALPPDAPAPATPTGLPHTGGPENPSAAAIRERFPDAVTRVEVTWGDTTVYLVPAMAKEILAWLRDDETQRYDYLSDVTCVEYRDFGRPLQVVWHLRSFPYRRFLRVKVELEKNAKLQVETVTDLWEAANWLEREAWDMFGVDFTGHPDLRRILMWEGYNEGFPLRKDFPLRGRFSRSEQLRQALVAHPSAGYLLEELTPEEIYRDLPADMRERYIAEHSED